MGTMRMQAALKDLARRRPSLPAGLLGRRRRPRTTRREVRRTTAGHISHHLAGPATAAVGNLELARDALLAGDPSTAAQLIDAALSSARELSERLAIIQQDFEVEGVER